MVKTVAVQPTPLTFEQRVGPILRPGPGRQLAIGTTVLGSLLLTRAVQRRLQAKRPNQLAASRRSKLPPLVSDALCGAVGEIAQIALLYPLDTIKVKCQAQGASLGTVIRQFQAMGMRKSTLRALYAGMGPSALCSCVIGAVYLVSFYSTKRLVTRLTDDSTRVWQALQHNALATLLGVGQNLSSNTATAFASISSFSTPETSALRLASQAGTLHAELPPHDSLHHQQQQQQQGTSAAAAASHPHHAHRHHEHHTFAAEPHSLHLAVPELAEDAAVSADSKPWVATLAAFVSSIVTSTFEAPVELFRHRLQAGKVGGSMLGNMSSALSTGGVASLYWNYSPFLLKAIPYDVAELFTYSQMSEIHRNSLAAPGGPRGLSASLANVPQEVMDMVVGAFAGATAVVLSMPSDCIKTQIEMASVAPPKGLVAGARHFMVIGRGLVRQNGVKSLFVGLAPRLADKVPSTMVYWLAVEGTRRALAPYIVGGPEVQAA